MFERVPTNEVRVEVTVKRPWLFDIDADHAYRKGRAIKEQIERHVDDVDDVTVIQEFTYRDSFGIEHESLYDVLEYLFDEDGALEKYEFTYERPSDNGIGTRSRTDSFKELIEEAWKNPWKFELVSGPKLTTEQEKFLARVVDAAMDQQMRIKED